MAGIDSRHDAQRIPPDRARLDRPYPEGLRPSDSPLSRAASSARSGRWLTRYRSFAQIGVTENAGDLQQSGSSSASAIQPAKARNFPRATTKAVVDFISTSSSDRMPKKAVDEGKRCLIDGFGVVLAGATVRGSAIAREYIKASGAQSGATILGPEKLHGDGGARSARQWRERPRDGLRRHAAVDHARSDVRPADASDRACAGRGAGGRRTAQRVGRARFSKRFSSGSKSSARSPRRSIRITTTRGFHTTGTIGTFGAAAAAAKLMKLARAAQVRHMLGDRVEHVERHPREFRIDDQAAARRRARPRTASSPRSSRRAASPAATTALDGAMGILPGVRRRRRSADRLIPVLGKPYTIVSPGVVVQAVSVRLARPSDDGRDAEAGDGTRSEAGPDQGACGSGPGRTSSNPLRYKIANNELEAKFCLPFLMSSRSLRRKAGVREFTDEFVASAPVQQMMPRVDNVFDQKIEAQGFDKIRSVVEMDLADGRTISQASDERYRGGPEKPFTREELHEKFTDCASLRAVEPNASSGRSRRSSRSIGSRASASWSRHSA